MRQLVNARAILAAILLVALILGFFYLIEALEGSNASREIQVERWENDA